MGGESGAQLERLGGLRPEEEPCDFLGGTCQAEGGKPSGSSWGPGAAGQWVEWRGWRARQPERPLKVRGLEAPGRTWLLALAAPCGDALRALLSCGRRVGCPRPQGLFAHNRPPHTHRVAKVSTSVSRYWGFPGPLDRDVWLSL